MPQGETTAHRELKRLALAWAVQERFTICASEVALPNSTYRADVAAYQPRHVWVTPDRPPRRPRKTPVIGHIALFECKQARSDFLKDSRSVRETTERLRALDQRRRTLERLLGMHLPSLRKGESLFAEYDACDLEAIEHRTYRRVMREIQQLQNRLYGGTKFDKLVQYQCANRYYLVAEAGVLAEHEVPLPWGLLVRDGEHLRLQRRPVWQEAPEPTRLLVLQRIAAAGTRLFRREFGLHTLGAESG